MEFIAGIKERFYRKPELPSVATTQKEDPLLADLEESIKLCAWWMEWPGHPGWVHPRCYGGSDGDKIWEAYRDRSDDL